MTKDDFKSWVIRASANSSGMARERLWEGIRKFDPKVSDLGQAADKAWDLLVEYLKDRKES